LNPAHPHGWTLLGSLLALVLLAPLARAQDPPAGTPTYEADIRPLLARHCTICHSARNATKLETSGGLVLDTPEAIERGLSDRKVVATGHADQSSLYLRLVETDEDRRMPLDADPLPEADRQRIARWIDAGLPRGSRPAPATTAAATPARRRKAPSLDLALPVATKVPPGRASNAQPAALELVARVGPLPAVTSLAFHPSAPLLAVGTEGQVVLWSLVDGRPVRSLAGIPGSAHALAFTRDGKRLAVGGGLPARNGTLRLYQTDDGALLHDLAGHEDVVTSVAFTPDGTRLASASFDHTVRQWDAATGQPAGVFSGHSDFVHAVLYAADGQSLYSCGKDRSIKQIAARDMTSQRTYSGHDDEIIALATRPDGKGLVSSGNEPQLRWWEFAKDEPVKRVGGHGGPVLDLAFSGDGKRLISASGDGSVRLWDGASGNATRRLDGTAEWQYACALDATGRHAAAGGWDGLVRVWNAESGALIATLVQPPGESPGASESPWLLLTPAGYWAASPSLDTLARYRVAGQEIERRRLDPYLQRPARLRQALAARPDDPFASP
jgi:hypothetical protein